MSERQLHLGAILTGVGNDQYNWRHPDVPGDASVDIDWYITNAKLAEDAKFDLVFIVDSPFITPDTSPHFLNRLEPLTLLSAVAGHTSRIGLVGTLTTSYWEPYNVARQFGSLDHISRGRAGWNVVTTGLEGAARNYGREEHFDHAVRYERAQEFVEVVQGLWDSYEDDAFPRDKDSGLFLHKDKQHRLDHKGRHFAVAGPLALTRSRQGQPVIFQAGGGSQGLEVAGRYASGVIGAVFTIEDARAQRSALRDAAERAGRNPDEIKFFAGLMTTIARDRREGLDRRIALSGQTFPQRALYLGQMLGLRLDPGRLDAPLTPEQLAAARPSPGDPRSAHALKIAREGWTLRDVLAHGVIDFHPAIVGPAVEAADHMQAWFEAGAADGFWLSPDVFEDGIDAFVDGVIPILQQRGLFHRDYEGTTLRDHLGAPAQYGFDPRVSG